MSQSSLHNFQSKLLKSKTQLLIAKIKLCLSQIILFAVSYAVLFASADSNANSQGDLYDAIKNKQTQAVLELLETNVDVNFEYTFSPLILAIQTDQEQVVEALIKHGADVEFRDLFPFSALEIALRKPDDKMLELLYKLVPSIDIDHKNIMDNGHTPLMQMAQLGDLKRMHWLLDKGADLHAKDTYKDQVLAVAAYHGQKEVVEFLLTLKIDVDNKNSFGDTALTHAKNRGHGEIVEMISAYKK